MKCNVSECENVANVVGGCRGMCGKHYQRWRKTGATEKNEQKLLLGPCEVDGCMSKVWQRTKGRHLCVAHAQRLAKYGDALGHSDKYRKRQIWMDKHSAYEADDCLKWPFSASAHGRGTATLDGKTMSAPRAMCILAHGKPPTNRHHASHSCGNGHLGCMNPNHLVWKTPKQNERDKIKHGTLRRGEAINTCKLTEALVYEIKGKIGSMTGVDIAREYGVSPTVISNIKLGRSWGWL